MKNFTKQNFKTNPLWIRLLIMAFMLLAGSSSAWGASLNTNTNDNRASGVEVQYNSTSKWYRIGSVSNMWNNGCTPKMSGSQNNPLDSHNFGTVTTLKLKGGEVNTRLNDCNSGCSDYAEARYSYKIYKINASEPSSYTTGFTANTWECGSRWDNASDVSIYNSANIDLLSGLGAGDYNLKMKMEIQARWSGGTYGNTWTHTASATFTVPGYSTTTGSLEIDDVNIGENSSQTKSLPHYGSTETAEAEVSGDNASEFTVTSVTATSITVTFTPTSAGPKTATITITDAYKKTYTLNVTGTGKQSCQAPTSVSVTGSETPCVGANETYTADIVGGSKYDLEWAVPDGYTIIEGQGTTSIIVEVGTTSGNITCTATCGNEAPSGEISVAPYTTIAPTISLSTEYVCPGESATITVESPELNVEGLSYKLYNKNDTSTPIAIITEPKTEPVAFTIQEGTYYVTVSHTCGGEKKSINEKTLLEYPAPEIPAYTLTNATRCKDVPSSDGSIVLKNPIGGISYQLDKVGSTTGWSSLAAGIHKLSATVNACPSLTEEWDIEVGEEDITPSATVTISGETSFCEGTSTELTCVVNATKGNPTAYQWYNGDNLIQDAINSTYSARVEGNYKVVVTVLNSTCQNELWSDEKVVTINPKPNEPVLSIPSPICAGSNFTLPEEDNNQRNITWNVNDRELTNLTAGTHNYTAKIIDVNGCESNEVTYTITVTALPEITSISQDIQEPVFYEDVTLTATATDGATVKWYEGGVEKATGTTYVVTSATEPSKTVTAKAFLNGCESAAASHTVAFSAETCNNVADMTKIYFDATDNQSFVTGSYVYVTITGKKDNNNSNGSTSCSGNGVDTSGGNQGNYVPKNDTWWGQMKKVSGESYIFEITIPNNVIITKGTTKLSFWNNKIDGYNDVYNVQAILGQKTISETNCMKLYSNKTHNTDRNSDFYCGTWVTYANKPVITAPAVKTVSVTSDEDGNVTMVGQVVKTGCDTQAILGLQYKKQKQDGTYDDNYTTYPNPGTKEAISAGKTFSVTTKLEDGTYKVRARIDNSHATNGYGEDIIVVVNTTKTPISNVTLNYCDKNGGNVGVDPNPMCKGAIAYVKLLYEGSKYSDIKWLVEGVETNLVTDEGDGVWSYEIQGDGSLSVELKNDANTDPAWPYSNKLPFTIIQEPTAPYISIDPASGVICEGSSATITVENANPNCSYKLVEEEEDPEVGFTQYESGDLKYTVQNVAKYYVVAQHNACRDNEYTSNQVAINQIISTSATISIEPNNPKTTPWEPVTITVNPQEGYVYELSYTDGNLAAVDGVRIKQNGDSYTYYIPRPDAWTTGDSNPVRTPINYGIKAQLKVDGEASQCQLNAATATIQLKDEDNENCPK
ncbi:MAG: hypothetical protein UFP03_01945 [Paludibacteraceae bacterium]|nr:hypothetical protein [Paludibacteraceae bacterium]